MSRYEHFLRPTKGDTIPRQWAAISTQAEKTALEGMPDCYTERLVSWSAVINLRQDEGELVCHEVSYKQSVALIGMLDSLCKVGGTTWLFSHGAARDFVLLGVWDLLESGELYLTGEDCRDQALRHTHLPKVPEGKPDHSYEGCGGEIRHLSQLPGRSSGETRGLCTGEVCAKGERKRGLAILEDPPTILLLRRPGRAGCVKWVDIRNYGIDWGANAYTDSQLHYRIAEQVRSLLGCLVRYGLGSLQGTASSQSLYGYKRNWLHYSVFVHCNSDALSLERSAYIGGRCECRRVGRIGGPIHYLDISSLYTSLGAVSSFPVRYCDMEYDLPISELERLVAQFAVIADVEVDATEPNYPVVWDRKERGPVWDSQFGHLDRPKKATDLTVYPTGLVRCSLCSPELVPALKQDRVVRCHSVAYYEMEPCFHRYCLQLLRWIKEAEARGDVDARNWLKRLAVSLWGKFGQSGRIWVDDPDTLINAPWSRLWGVNEVGEPVIWRSLGWHVQREVREEESGESCPAIAAWITSLGRAYLLEHLQLVPEGHLFYYDTDSLWVDNVGLAALHKAGKIGSGEPGRLRLKGSYDWAHFYGVKYYETPEGITCSGLPRGEKWLSPDGLAYVHRKWLASELGRGHKPSLVWALRDLQRNSPYQHGVVNKHGEVFPFRVN